MLREVKDLRLHIGAHKTATTHLQDSLGFRHKELLAKGVDYIPRNHLNDINIRPKPGILCWRTILGGRPMIRYFEKKLDSKLQGVDRVVISDEKFIGGSWELLYTPIYPRIEKRLRALSTLDKLSNVTFYLSIRSFDEILPSAYAQAIRYSPIDGGFQPIREKAAQNPPSWVDLIKRIGQIIPLSRVRIWRLEDYRYNELDILSALCGVDIPRRDPIPIPKSTKSPSWEAINEIEALSNVSTRKSYKALIQDIVERDQGSCRFKPFKMNEVEILKEKYEEDVFRIEKEFPCWLIKK